jgi:hypothetical protein
MIISNREKVLSVIIFLLVLIIIVAGTWYITTGLNKSSADTNISTAPTDTSTDNTSEATTKPTLLLKAGWNLVSIPYILSPSDGKTVLLGLDTREAYARNDSTGEWVSLYQSGTITPGQGIWIRSEAGQAYQLPVQTTPVDTSTSFTISLHKGWNAIGNPFPKDITWNPTVKTAKGSTTFAKAVDAKILSVGYASDPASKEYIAVQPNDTIKANQGLMVKSGGDNIDLVLSAN